MISKVVNREINDYFRIQMPMTSVFLSRSIDAMEDNYDVVELVKNFNDFNENNNPDGEHDFGAFDFNGQQIFWKINYYDATDMNQGSANPSDSAVTRRVLTIMLAEDY